MLYQLKMIDKTFAVKYFQNYLIIFLNQGESAWCPSEFKYFDQTAKPDAYSQNYVKIAAGQNNFVEVRTAHGVQDSAIFYRILDRATDWTIHDGIKSVVTATLQFGLLGYPFVLPGKKIVQQYKNVLLIISNFLKI